MDPIAALSLAGNVAQFIDLGCKVFSMGGELYRSASGRLVEDIQLQAACESLELLTSQKVSAITIGGPMGQRSLSPAEKELFDIAGECHTLTKELQKALASLKVAEVKAINLSSSRKSSRRESQDSIRKRIRVSRAVLGRLKKSGEIDRLSKRLDSLRSRLTVGLLHLIQYAFCVWDAEVVADENTSDEQSTTHTSLQAVATKQPGDHLRATNEIPSLNEQNAAILQQLTSLQRTTSSMAKTIGSTPSLWNFFRGAKQAQDLDEVSSKLLEWMGQSEEIAARQHFLRSLYYPSLETRRSAIMDAHTHTFEWIFQSESSVSGFSNWIEHQNGIYWISGKAGSGKSTLMKFLHDHPKTKAALRTWAGDKAVVTSHFFFWKSGEDLQKSQEGLLRALLWEALMQFPSLVEDCFPKQWSEYHRDRSTAYMWPWTYAELLDAFGLLAKQTKVAAKFCFFIDGLDEYEGDCEQIARLLSDLATTSSNFKMCVSSRPWNVFQAAFGGCEVPKLRLEDLTRDDIRAYVTAKLGEDERYRSFQVRQNNRDSFVEEIVSRANGVFLWVHLVVHSLLDGMRNEDRLSDLERRLRLLPNTLEDYFLHMWNNLGDAYQQQAAKTLCIALAADRPLTLMTFSMLDEEEHDFAIKWDTRPMTQDELIRRHEVMKRRLNARCKDLLEVKPCWNSDQTFPAQSRKSPQNEANAREFFSYRVELLHRTVVDFLTSDEMQGQMSAKLPPEFDPWKQLCHAFLGQIKRLSTTPRNVFHNGPMSSLVDDLVDCVRKIATGSKHRQQHIQLMLELRKAMGECEDEMSNKASILLLPAPEQKSAGSLELDFLIYSVRKGLLVFVEDQLQREFRSMPPQEFSLLIKASLHLSEASASTGIPDPAVLQLILKNVDQNRSASLQPIWNEFLSATAIPWEEYPISSRIVTGQIINLLLDAEVHDVEPGISDNPSWADVLLMSRSNWTCGSEELCNLLCSAIDKVLSQDIDVNAAYKGSTLWGHFVRNIADRSMDTQIRRRLHGTVRAFIERGADCTVFLPVAQETNIAGHFGDYRVFSSKRAVELLLEMYSEAELEQIGLYGNPHAVEDAVQLGHPAQRNSSGFWPVSLMWSVWGSWSGRRFG